MKTRRLTILLVAGVLAAAGLTAFTIPASAQSETVSVRLPSGQVVQITVDVPPGGSLQDIKLPGTIVNDRTKTAQAETPGARGSADRDSDHPRAPARRPGAAVRGRRLPAGTYDQRRARSPGAREGPQDHCRQASSEG